MERPSDTYKRLSQGRADYVSQRDLYRKLYEKSSVDLRDVEDELGMLEAVLIDEPEYDEPADDEPVEDEPPAFGSHWWATKLDTVYCTNASLREVDLKKAIVEALRKNSHRLQEELMDLLGMDQLEFVSDLLQHRQPIVAASQSVSTRPPRKATAPKVSKKQERQGKEMSLEEALKSVYLGGSHDALQYPFVFSSVGSQTLSVGDSSMALPLGTVHENLLEFETFTMPHHSRSSERALSYPLVGIHNCDDPFIKTAFSGYQALNRMQSICYECAYNSNENMLVCAPTGAGKTDIAMLTVLKCIKNHAVQCDTQHSTMVTECSVPMTKSFITATKHSFKIIYVAPMKALAAEITSKFSKRLAKLGISVRECTGDTQLSRQEIQRTQMLVTTPEKWDVLSRKGVGDTDLVQLVKLLIIDEVHLLQDNRGAVLEAIVARTLRQVEMGQSMIRILGLSATLPNYVDVAAFLRVNPFAGMFFFDDAFRPVPLTQHFVGVKGKQRGLQIQRTMKVCYQECTKYLSNDHQVMIFVHSRNETVKTARNLLELAADHGCSLFNVQLDHPDHQRYSKSIAKSRNAELKELFKFGIGVHHAGMLRPDRALTESMFECGVLRVLVCTATLAWGVNLPAHAVIIKGTQVYDAVRGGFVDLGILDVRQIFGRAGRPQFESHGEGVLITSHDRLSHYMHAMCSQTPIESKFIEELHDNLNAEVALGTVSNVKEAVQWLAYTFLYVRMRRNPLAYGISLKERMDDPNCSKKLVDIVKRAAYTLKQCAMISFDRPDDEGFMKTKNIGRIASLYYLSYGTIDLLVKLLRPEMNPDELLQLMSQSSEFDSVKVREEELDELDALRKTNCFLRTPGDFTCTAAKVNVLIQCHISRATPEAFSLQADMNYVQQNTGRILRSLFEIVKGLGWASCSARVLVLCCSFERRRWHIEHPLMQFDNVPADVVGKLDGCKVPFEELMEADLADIAKLARNHQAAGILKGNLQRFPWTSVDAKLQPLTSTVLKVVCCVTPSFLYDQRVHGAQESFHVWIEDADHMAMHAYQSLVLTAKEVVLQEGKQLDFFVQLPDPRPPQLFLRLCSDRWLHAEQCLPLSLRALAMPADLEHTKHTELLPLSPLPVSALQDAKLVAWMARRFEFFNPVQTQVFHALFHRDCNVLIGAPTGSGKTVMAELAMLRQLVWGQQARKAVYLAPLKALVRERLGDWSSSLASIGLSVVELTGDHNPGSADLRRADLILSTPEKWDAVSRKWKEKDFVRQVGLIVFDEIHLLGVPGRGAVLEAIVMRLKSMSVSAEHPVRIVGLSTALANAADLADWLDVPAQVGLFNFSPAVRPVPIEVRIEGFPGAHYCPRMAAMNKPLYGHIKTLYEGKSTLVFVMSRRQTRLTAQALISYDSLQSDGSMDKSFLRMADSELEAVLASVEDPHLKHCLSFGIGLHHAGLSVGDRSLVERLFCDRKVLVLVSTGTLAWGINLPAFLVVIKGSEYFDAKHGGYVDMPVTDMMQMVGRAGRPQFDVRARAVLLVAEHKRAFYRKFLYESFPVESSLLGALADHLNAEIASGAVYDLHSGLQWLGASFLARRLRRNPSFYSTDSDHCDAFAKDKLEEAVHELVSSGCVAWSDGAKVSCLFPGKVAYFYCLQHLTIKHFVDSLHTITSVGGVLNLISDAHEYDEAPVRHNEDVEVRDFVAAHRSMVPEADLFLKTADFARPQTKVYCLFAAWMSRTQLPFCDWVVDQAMALEQSLRIAQGLLELLVVRGRAEEVVLCLRSMQCLKQACRGDDDPLSVYFDAAERELLQRNGIRDLSQLLTANTIFQEFSARMPKIDLFKRSFHNLHSSPASPLQKQGIGCNWYVLVADKQGKVLVFDKLHQQYKLPTCTWARLHIISDCWYGLDQQHNNKRI